MSLHRSRAGQVIAGVLLLVLLVGCGDDDSGRQFAGDEQSSAVVEDTPVVVVPTQQAGSPQPLGSPLTEQQMFVPRGSDTVAAIIVDGMVYRYDVVDADLSLVPVDDKFDPWLVDVSPATNELAVLVSPKDSLVQWKVQLFDGTGELTQEIPVVGGQSSPVATSEVVATGTGGMDWSPDGSTIAVALPTGGIYAVTPDVGVEQMSPAQRVPRPGDIAWSPEGQALAFASQPHAKSGFGLSLATANAYPLDAVQLLQPDPTGNRSVKSVEWMPDGSQILAIVERKETGGARGEIFAIPVEGGQPELTWTSGIHTEAGADSMSISPDGQVVAILSENDSGQSVIVLRQLDGPSEVRRDLEIVVDTTAMLWTDQGLVLLSEFVGVDEGQPAAPVVIRVDTSGNIVDEGAPQATPLASPQTEASPMASPVASPASPVASPVMSPIAAPGNADE